MISMGTELKTHSHLSTVGFRHSDHTQYQVSLTAKYTPSMIHMAGPSVHAHFNQLSTIAAQQPLSAAI